MIGPVGRRSRAPLEPEDGRSAEASYRGDHEPVLDLRRLTRLHSPSHNLATSRFTTVLFTTPLLTTALLTAALLTAALLTAALFTPALLAASLLTPLPLTTPLLLTVPTSAIRLPGH